MKALTEFQTKFMLRAVEGVYLPWKRISVAISN